MKFKMLFILTVCNIVAIGGCNNQLSYDESGYEYESTVVSESNTNIDEAETNGYSEEPTDVPTEFLNESLNKKLIYDVKKEMEVKGWKNIVVDEGWGKWKAFCEMEYGYIPPKDYLSMYTLCGTFTDRVEEEICKPWGFSNGLDIALDIVVQVVFDEDNPNGYIYKVFYTSDTGRCLYSDSHINDFFKDNEILPAELEDLWGYMYSY